MQMGLLGLENRYASLSGLGDPLERLNGALDWDIFAPTWSGLTRRFARARRAASQHAGC